MDQCMCEHELSCIIRRLAKHVLRINCEIFIFRTVSTFTVHDVRLMTFIGSKLSFRTFALCFSLAFAVNFGQFMWIFHLNVNFSSYRKLVIFIRSIKTLGDFDFILDFNNGTFFRLLIKEKTQLTFYLTLSLSLNRGILNCVLILFFSSLVIAFFEKIDLHLGIYYLFSLS